MTETKTYRVRSLSDAMQLISEELGPDASVLHTRRLQPSLWKWWDRSQWEVVAGTDPAVPERFTQFLLDDLNREDLTASEVSNTSGSNRHSVDEFWAPIVENLHQLGVATETIAMLNSDLQSGGDSEDPMLQIAALFAERLKFAGGLQLQHQTGTRVALVGPTGVGKTTTIAKLAADFQLRLGQRVGLITVDTFRVAAVEQLQAYAEIMDVPLVVVRNPAEMQNAIRQFADFDLVLIDTVGRSPRDRQRIESMNQILAAANLDHLLITVSASSDVRTMEAAVAAHAMLPGSAQVSLVLTKVDECQTLAGLYPFLRGCSIPWSYWTNGQQVPADLGVAQADVAAWFLGEIE